MKIKRMPRKWVLFFSRVSPQKTTCKSTEINPKIASLPIPVINPTIQKFREKFDSKS
jgi:hypothetical protein